MPTIDVFNPGSTGVEKSQLSSALLMPASMPPMGMPLIAGVNGVRAVCDSYNFGGATLVGTDSSRFNVGDSIYVATLRQTFTLHSIVLPEIYLYQLPALNKQGYTWIRDQFSPAWWSQDTWIVDPKNGKDEWGGSAAFPLKSFAEQGRRFRGRGLPGGQSNNYTINLVNNALDDDFLQVHLDPNLGPQPLTSSICTLQGISTVVAVSTPLTAVTDCNPGSGAGVANTANVGADWSSFTGKIARLQGTTGTSMCAAIIESTNGNVVTFGEQYQNGTILPGFTNGQIVEVISTTKFGGMCVQAGYTNSEVVLRELTSDPATKGVALLGGPFVIASFFCEFRGASTGFALADTFSSTMCSFNTRDFTITGTANALGVSLINMHVDLLTNKNGRHHWQSCGGYNSTIRNNTGSLLRITSNYHMFGLQSGRAGFLLKPEAEAIFAASYYGSGNDPNSAGFALPIDARVFYSFPPNMDAGQAVYYDGNGEGLITGGHSLPFTSLPLIPGNMSAYPIATQSAKLVSMLPV